MIIEATIVDTGIAIINVDGYDVQIHFSAYKDEHHSVTYTEIENELPQV